MNKTKRLTGRAVSAMTPAQRQRLADELDAETPAERLARSKPLTPRQRERIMRAGKQMGRPRLGKGTRVVSVTVELDLLKRADAFAASAGMKRSELFTRGLHSVLPKGDVA